jgi:hypothetical protein
MILNPAVCFSQDGIEALLGYFSVSLHKLLDYLVPKEFNHAKNTFPCQKPWLVAIAALYKNLLLENHHVLNSYKKF